MAVIVKPPPPLTVTILFSLLTFSYILSSSILPNVYADDETEKIPGPAFLSLQQRI